MSSFEPEKKWCLFYKLMVPSIFQAKKLKIPKKFVKKFGNELQGTAALTVPDEGMWAVSLTDTDGRLCFDIGWHEFMKIFSIQIGHFLVFRYEGHAHFTVDIFELVPYKAKNQLNSVTTTPVNHRLHLVDHEMEGDEYVDILDCSDKSEDDDSVDILGSSPASSVAHFSKQKICNDSFRQVKQVPHASEGISKSQVPASQSLKDERKRKMEQEIVEKILPSVNGTDDTSLELGQSKSKKRKSNLNENEFLPRREEEREIVYDESFSSLSALLSTDCKRVIDAAKRTKLKNPSFMVLWKQNGLLFNKMRVPDAFAKKYLNSAFSSVKIEMSDGRQWLREWVVKVEQRKRRGLYLTEGWFEFSRDNEVREGDVCVFELIMTMKNVVLKALIFHASLE